MLKLIVAIGAATASLGPVALAAQPDATDGDPPVNEIVVTAKRSGAPMWTIDTPTGAVLLVGEIAGVPKITPWQPDRLEEAASEADRVILRARPKFSAGDVFRMIFSGGKITKLPNRTTAGDYLSPEQRARLARLEAEYDIDYDRRSFLMTSFDLLARRLDFDDDTTKDPTDIVKKAAKRADIAILTPERFRGEDLLDDLAAAPTESHIPCLEAAMTATEEGPSVIQARGDAWREFDVAAVMDNALERALGTCWPWADDDLGTEIRDQWTGMIAEAASETGTTLAVVPLRVLAEDGGVLDQLEQRGFPIYGPDWR